MESRRIGMLGSGNMAGALIRGLIASGTVQKDQVRASDVRRERLDELHAEFGIETTQDNKALVSWADLLVLSIKPQVMDRVLEQVGEAVNPDTLVVSIAAGVPIRAIESRLHSGVRVVRAMPNTAAIVLAGATGVAPGAHATEEDVEVTRTLFEAVGRTVVLDESLIDAVTGLSGSGPAYIMLMIEALADGGVKVGLHRDTALLLAAQTVFGSAKLLLETGEIEIARLVDIRHFRRFATNERASGLPATRSGACPRGITAAASRRARRPSRAAAGAHGMAGSACRFA